MPDIESFISFLEASPTSHHCVQQVGTFLSKQGFHSLDEKEKWVMKQGDSRFVSRGGSIAAFSIPQGKPSGIVLLAAHTDSPALKIKPFPLVVKEGYAFLETETYGSPILHSWVGRELAIAGKVFCKDTGGNLKEELIFLKETPLIIPELAIHLQRDVNEKGPLVNKQDDMTPVFSVTDLPEGFTFESLIKRSIDCKCVVSFDLFLVPIEKPGSLGFASDWIASYRLDNLASVHAATVAMTSYKSSSVLPIAVFWDHEEIGSRSWEGACSTFLNDTLSRIRSFYEMSEEEFLILKRNSLCLSLDMAHAVSPMHPEKHDPNHKPVLGKGLTVKYNADLKYASSASTVARALGIAERAKVPLQHFTARSDMSCGSTVGSFIASSVGIPTVDLGCPQFSMHSAREIMAKDDYVSSVTFLTEALKGL